VPDRRTWAVFAVLGLLAGALVAGVLAIDLTRQDDGDLLVPLPVTLAAGLVAGLLAAPVSYRLRRRRQLVPLAGVGVGLLVGVGVYLWARFGPSTDTVVYHGRYVPLDGVTMSRSYSSRLDIVYDVPASWWSLLAVGAVAGLVAGAAVWLVGRLRGWPWPSGRARR
jgi:ABC-type branched-subunit amino acid transport system permease subunit